MPPDGPVAEFNMGRLLHDWDDPRVSGFVAGLDRVNRLAAASPGFLWRMPDEAMEAAQLGPPLNDGRVASTLSVWRSVADLRRFVHEGLHRAFMARASRWFEPHDGPAYVIWPVRETGRPRVREGLARLDRLREHGPSAQAFDFAWIESQRGAE